MSLAKNQHTHTFLLVKLLCGKQDKEQHGKGIGHSEGQLFGVLSYWRGQPEAKCGKKIRQSKSNMKQLTLSLDYTWNEKGMIKKEEGGWQKQSRERMNCANLRATWKQENIYNVDNVPHKTENEGKNIKSLWEMSAMEITGCRVEGR